MNSALGSKSRCLLATPVAASTKFRDAHRLCFDAPQIQLNISVPRWRLRSQQSCGAVISLDCSPPDETTKRHTEPAVYGFTCRFIRRKSASRWRADNHDDLFTVEHLVARHHSGSCRTVWTLMPALPRKGPSPPGCRSHMPGLYEEYRCRDLRTVPLCVAV